MAYTTDKFLESVKRRSAMPSGANTFSDDELLDIADEILMERVMPAIIGQINERLVRVYDQSTVQDQANYALHSRSLSQNLREVKLVKDTMIRNLVQISLEEVESSNSGTPDSFYFQGDEIYLYPTPSDTTWTLRQYYFCRPGDLVLTADAGLITAKTSTTITVSSIPSTWATGDIFDVVSKERGHPYRCIDQTSTLVSGTTITFSSVPSNVSVGDYITEQGTSPLIQLPDNYIPGFAMSVAGALLQYLSQPGAEEAWQTSAKMLHDAAKVLQPRVTGEVRPVVPRNPWR